MVILRTTVMILCLISSTVGLPKAKEWCGIVPLRSKRSDVERLLGPPTEPNGSIYKSENESVYVSYSSDPCKGRPNGWNVPRDTVLQISVYPKKDQPFTELNIDESKYKKEEDPHRRGAFYYSNEAEGHTIVVNQGMVRGMHYGPTTEDANLRCSNPKTHSTIPPQ